jgi:hypothetical protein
VLAVRTRSWVTYGLLGECSGGECQWSRSSDPGMIEMRQGSFDTKHNSKDADQGLACHLLLV